MSENASIIPALKPPAGPMFSGRRSIRTRDSSDGIVETTDAVHHHDDTVSSQALDLEERPREIPGQRGPHVSQDDRGDRIRGPTPVGCRLTGLLLEIHSRCPQDHSPAPSAEDQSTLRHRSPRNRCSVDLPIGLHVDRRKDHDPVGRTELIGSECLE